MIIFLMGLFTAMGVRAQGADVDFTAQSNGFTVSGKALEVASTLTKDGQSLTWEQRKDGNTYRMVFTIASFEGQWDLGQGTGQGSYALEHQGKTGTLALSRIPATSAVLTLATPEGDLRYTFSMTNLILR